MSGGTVQAGEVHGGVHFHHAPVSPVSLPRPSQLPRSPVHFTDRGDHLNALDTACTAPDGAPLVALSGISGIGKSALAVHWLTQRRESYPDGLLYADIHRAGGPRQVLRRWLNALGHRQSPGDLDELAALWRSVTTGLRIAVLVDDVRDPAQVAHLMPAGTNSLTVVTGRRKHWELALQGAFFQDLHPLPSDEAVQLLTRYLGMGEERTSADVAAARRISEACACVPLALALTGARLAAHGDLPLALLLTPTPSPSLEDPAVDAINTALDAAYGRLLPGAQFLYRTLGVLPTASFDTHGTAAAADIPLPDAGQHLTALCNARLLEAQASGRFGPRYAFTAAAQSHAQGLAEATDGARARSQTVRRWCDWVLWTATEAQKLLTPAQATLPRTYAHQPVGPALFHDATGALAWLEDHQDAVLATVSAAADAEWHDTAWQLADALWPLFHYLHLYELWIAVHRIGLRSAILAGNRPAERQMHNSGAIGLSNSGLLEEAIEWYSRSLRAATAAGDARDEGQAHIGLAACHFNARRLEAAEWDVRQAITAWDSCDYRRGVGLAWTLKGEIAVAQGDLSQAVRSFTSAHRELTEVDDPFNAARALAFRGHARALDGDHEVGIRELGQALVTFDDAGAQRWQARGRHLLGQAYAAAGDTGTARAHYADSADRYDRFDPPRAEEVRALLAAL
ncbi:NB-ARC domain-containing protein [Streptomyces sp. NBC_00838]|uniref:NB-ARC domain-containing protein n=1 Tax=Streptomyces sp. NBC_00838 TaxID=2903680 RepID=UPI003864FB30|nr:NB-ARC domain-containing protein [Streptomyces sp. NBC_00838]